ncbi:MAG: FecR domain-containing protein, partial [Pseudomonadota bacterium]
MSSVFGRVRLSFIGFFAVGAASVAQAQILDDRPNAIVANVAEAKGSEDFTPVELANWRDLLAEQDLSSGDVVRTGDFGGLGIAFADRTYLRLHANSQMTVADPGVGTAPKRFKLSIGRMWSRASDPERPVIVETPSATAAIRGTDWFMEVLDDGASRLVVLDGQVRFFNEFGDLPVDAGRSAIARPGAAPEFELEITPTDRPRWALTPRSDWISFLPFQATVKGAAARDEAAVWSALQVRRPRAAQAVLDNGIELDAADANLASALIDLMMRNPQAAETKLSDISATGDRSRLAAAAAAGAAIDTADFTLAVERLNAYEAAFGEDISLLALRAYLEAYAGRYDAAGTFAARAAERAPTDWRRLLLTAQIAALKGDDDAFDVSTRALLEEAPDAFETWHLRGIYLAAAGAGTPLEVQAAFEKAVALNGEFVPSIVAVAQLQGVSGDNQAALEMLDRALELDPTEPFAISAKAFTYLTMDRLDLADAALAPVLETPIALHPEFQSAIAVRELMAGRADPASRATGTVIAA